MLKRFLVRYHYGQGSLWAFVLADNQAEVESRFRNVLVYADPPDWFTEDMAAAIQTHPIDKPGGWLPMVLRTP